MITAIIAAAGKSTRMPHRHKLLLAMGENTVIGQVLDRLTAVKGIDNTIIVVSSTDKEIQKFAYDHPAGLSVVLAYNSSLADSIIAGIQNAPEKTSGIMICLGDMPLITSWEYEKLIHAFLKNIENNPATILIPVYKGEWGHPRIFSALYRKSILEQQGKDGLKELIKQEAKNIITVEMDSDNILMDIDTPDDYSRIKVRF